MNATGRVIARCVSHLASRLIRGLALTWRFRVEGLVPEHPCVVAFWHGEMLPVWKFFAQRSGMLRAALTSLSNDGAVLAQLLADWGYALVRGSSSSGGKEALAALVQHAERGYAVFLTPDGPRGVRHTFKAGAIVIASRTGVPLVLCRAEYNGWTFERSWDKFRLPFPFASITLRFTHVFAVPPVPTPKKVTVVAHLVCTPDSDDRTDAQSTNVEDTDAERAYRANIDTLRRHCEDLMKSRETP